MRTAASTLIRASFHAQFRAATHRTMTTSIHRSMSRSTPSTLKHTTCTPIRQSTNISTHHNRSFTICAAATTGDYVEIHYTGTLDDGSVFDSSREREPLNFVIGTGKVVAGFEEAVTGLSEGEKRTQRIEPAKAYGEWSENMTARVPVANAPQGLEAGSMVQLQNGMPAKVMEVDKDFVTIDANHPLAGKNLTFDVELVKHVPAAQIEKAAFGGGCFWGVELNFQRIPGVLNTEVGYSQGHVENVTYEQVCSGNSGHTEVVLVTYDNKELDFEHLSKLFFDFHDPTTLNRQGNDVGSQYRSGIYISSNAQKEAAERALDAAQEKYSGQVVTEVEPLSNYTRAEEEHQQYLEKGGRFGRPQSAKKGCSDKVRCYG